jgi:hypothetical protein
MTTLRFVPYSSAFDTGFWHELTRRKLDIYRLDSSNIPIYGYYSNGKNQISDCLKIQRFFFIDANDNMPALFNVDHQCFDE